MRQLTLRMDDELARRLTEVASQSGRSVNAYAGAVLRAATDPSLAGDEAQQLRERLARAGLLASSGPARAAVEPEPLAAARRRAGRGRPLSDLVGEGR